MVQQHIMPPQLFKQVLGLRRQPELARNKRPELQFWMLGLLVNVKQTRQVHWAVNWEHLPGVQLKDIAQPLDDFGVRVGLDLHPHGIAFAPVVQLGAYGLEKTSSLLLREIEIAVTRDAKGSRGNDIVAVVHARGMKGHQVRQKDEIVRVFGRQANQPGQGAWHRDHPGIGHRRTTPSPQQERNTQRFVNHARKGMRRIHSDWCQQRIQLPLTVFFDE